MWPIMSIVFCVKVFWPVLASHVSVKAIVAGTALLLSLSFLLTFLSIHALMPAFGELANGVNFANEFELHNLSSEFLYHPTVVAVTVLATLIGVGIPAYVAAFLAGQHFVLHSMVIGTLSVIFALLELPTLSQSWALFLVIVIGSLVIAFLAGCLRQRQAAQITKSD